MQQAATRPPAFVVMHGTIALNITNESGKDSSRKTEQGTPSPYKDAAIRGRSKSCQNRSNKVVTVPGKVLALINGIKAPLATALQTALTSMYPAYADLWDIYNGIPLGVASKTARFMYVVLAITFKAPLA